MYAVKILKSSFDTESEIKALRQCRKHPNIVEYIDDVKDDEYTYIVTELLEGPELFAYVQKNPLSETEARTPFSEILKAVEFMHSKNIVHRDLKLENIMFQQANTPPLKLIDFGFAACMNKPFKKTQCYTLEYAAPEILLNKKYNEACDLWSLGVILYTLLCGHTPFQRRNESRNESEMRDRIKRSAIDTDSSEWQSLNKSAKDLIRSLLTVCPSKRMKLQNIRDSGWFEAPINSHSSATEIIESATERQTFIDDGMPTILITTTTAPLGKSHSTSTTSINSLGESGATSELGLSKSSSGIGIASDQFNRSISIDSNASTIRNDMIPDHDNDLDDTKEILVTTMATYLNDMQYEPIEVTESAHIEPIDTQIISDSENELCVNTDGEYQDLWGYECHSASTLRNVQHNIDLSKVLSYNDEEISLPWPGHTIEIEPENVILTSATKLKRSRRDADNKRKYSNSSDERWFDEPEQKVTKMEQIDDSECILPTSTPKSNRVTRTSLRRQCDLIV